MRALALAVSVLLAGCPSLSPPCTRAAQAVCPVKSQADACKFLLGAERDDAAIQAACEELLPDAAALAEGGESAVKDASWQAARARLEAHGFVADKDAGRIERKLQDHGGPGSKLVDRYRESLDEANRQAQERGERAFDEASR